MEKINQLAVDEKLQYADIYPRCIGKATQEEKSVYYILVESQRLQDFRKAVHKLACEGKTGMCPSNMDPELSYFHVTVGYTHHDLFLKDNVFKHPGTCFAGLDIF